jgi:hypothetical protein
MGAAMTERKCAWCQVVTWRDLRAKSLTTVETSHGICAVCLEKTRSAIGVTVMPSGV